MSGGLHPKISTAMAGKNKPWRISSPANLMSRRTSPGTNYRNLALRRIANDGFLLDLGAVDHALVIHPDAFRAAGGARFGVWIGVRDEGRNDAVLDASHPDAALPARIVAIANRLAGLGV